ncbi:helicase domino isoform X4 [Macrobrachium rosenbergii]|uniref:helicase domino isoform X4 n=1 Tax=Macrobrachium rosenbergii TaxID=79674 RepID=UPI0034D3BDE4
MSARDRSSQNETSTSTHNVIDNPQSAGGPVPTSSSSSSVAGGGMESQLAQPQPSPLKGNIMGSGDGELVKLADNSNVHTYTPHSSPVPPIQATAVAAEVTPNSTPSSSPRRPLSLSSEPPAKRIKIEDKPTDSLELRKVIIEWKTNKLESVKEKYNSHLVEKLFLENVGNLMDYQSWCRRPPREFLNYIRQHKLEGDESLEAKFTTPSPFQLVTGVQVKTENTLGAQPSPSKANMGNLAKTSTSPVKPGKGLTGVGSRQKTLSTSENTTMAAQQDQMVEKARQEAYVVQRIAALRKEGLWSEKRLPKVHEPPRPKAHWDYLLEEMVWLSADFAQERKWKKAAAKKCARMVQKYFMDKALQAQKEEKEKEMRTRKIAAFIAKEVRTFWSNTEKFIHFKITTKLDEKKKKALDQQLSFIVDQTEKYSSMLAESMNKPAVLDSAAVSTCTTPSQDARMSDEEFQPEESSDDDEATIAKEEDNPEEQESELQLLQQESEQTIEDLLKDLPEGYFQEIQQSCSNSPEQIPEEITHEADEEIVTVEDKEDKEPEKAERKGKKRKAESENADEDFKADESGEDDENTIEEEEAKEGETDHQKELAELQAENEMSVEELRKKYVELAANAEPMEKDESEDESSEEEEESEDEGVSGDDEKEDGDSDDEEEEEVPSDEEEEDLGLGLETLMEEDLEEPKGDREKADKELQDATAAAEALQPKGFTLSSTSVTTPIPFLLKHMLREYQHVGLDWLTTMYDKRLNGILADEMGLGKTIQTIALLAHLACEKRNWGPHLIVVPTSVMLNWEMEFKKWCPAFKILTYYGTQKERKMKRQGWTKPNAFHICITSYKLVIQDHQSFRRKKWKYFILDEAQNIKNFKSQRWQLLLNFQSQRRLLLTGTPLQNNLMELWSLMHFLMPNVFASHREFREWFSNPVTGMIEGNKEYNENIIKRLHKVLRPFILRRLKTEVEQQMPKKFEHVVMCRLSKRQRYLYEEFMSRTKTKETLASGNFLSVINVLMQLRKVCNHPNLFEPRPTISPFMMESVQYDAPSIIYGICDYDPFKHIDLFSLNLLLADLELCLTAFAAHRIRKFQASRRLIEEIDSAPDPPPKCPAGKIKLHVRPSSQSVPKPPGVSPATTPRPTLAAGAVRPQLTPTPTLAAAPTALQAAGGVRFHLVQQGGTIKAIQVPASGSNIGSLVIQQTPQGPRLMVPQRTNIGSPAGTATVGTASPSGGLQLLQTASGQLLLTTAPVQKPATPTLSQGISGTAAAALLQRLQGLKGLQGSTITTGAGGRPVLRLPLPANTLRPHTQVVSGAQSVASPLRTQTPAPVPAVSTPPPAPAPTTTASSTIIRPSTPSPAPRTSAPSTPTKPTTRTEQREAERQEEKRKDDERKRSLFFLNDLDERKKKSRKEKLSLIARLNIRKCHACPIYGADLIEAVTVIGNIESIATSSGNYSGQGLVHCLHATSPNPRAFWIQTDVLHQVVYTPEKYLKELKDITDRFIFVVPAVLAPPIVLRICHPPPSKLWQEERQQLMLKKEIAPYLTPLHHIMNASVTQFPDPRLIQYDCGKLQTLDRLLRQLKSGSHRVLIFTQMTKMLDVFEAFLNYHGHLYLRLDGTTRVEQRQVLMERFNQDKRIFAFILSTRSGGIGVNLTGADTVIFYDSDWNPTMDAQAQDRCHRIGQTRDVHIYRLISEKTIEENILKKANQKRLLGDLAIEGGNFTTAHFKKSTIQDLFDVNVAENDAAKRMSEVLEKKPGLEEGKEAQPPEGERVVGAFESALAAAEDETDVQAAKIAKAEAAAELAEFDETLPLNEDDREGGQELSKAEQEVAMLMKQLTPIELYALKFLESREDYQAEAERMSAEIEQQKKEWELGRLQALKEEEERLAQSSDEDLLTYASADAHNQVWLSLCGREEMPIWHPPTPPRDENDLYIDHSLGFWYDPSIMPESALPPFYIKKEHKRIKIEPGTGALANDETVGLRRVQKHRREDAVYAPRSLFDRPSPAVVKIRQALKHQKYRGIVRPSIPFPGSKPSLLTKPPVAEPENAPEWTVNEDWAVVQALQQHLQVELPINLLVLSPGHTPNWDLVADLVNSVSRCFRSARHCRARYESTILPREEGKLPPDTPTKKISKKQKSGILSKPLHKSSRPMRTSHLFREDNNSTYSGLYSSRFETIKSIAIKRTPTTKPPLINSTHKNPKHAQVLLESGIQYDNPLNPGQVAANLAERIQRAKQKSQAAAELAQQQKLLQQQQQQQLQLQQQQQAQITANQLQHQLQQQTQGQSQPQATQQQQGQQGQQQVSVVGSSAVQQVVSSGLTTKVATSVVLSQGTAMTVATVTATTSASTPATSTAAAAILSGVRTAVGTTASATAGRPTLSLQELQVRTPGTVVTVASLTPAQLTTAKITATLATQSSTQKGRALTAAQMQYLKQQAQARQAITLQHQQQGKVVAADQTIKRVQIGGQSGTTQKVQVAVSGGPIAGVNPIQVSQAGRTQLVKPGTVVAGTSGVMATGKVTRTVTDREVAAILKQQQLSKTGQMAQVQVPSAQLLAGLQVQGGVSGGGTPVPTLVKTVSAPSTLVHTPTCVTLPVSAINVTLPQARVSTAATVTKAGNTQQTVRNIPLQQQILAKQRSLVGVKGPVGLQLGSKAVGSSGLSTVQIVQGGGQKQMSHVTVQQIQQVLKQVPQQSIQHITQGGTVSGTIVGKAVAGGSVAGTSVATSGTQGITTSHTTKLIPMTVSSQQQQSIKQTIQVVSAGSPVVGGGSAIRVSAGERTTTSTLALQSGSVKVTNPILSQVSAALQPMSVAVRTPTQSPVRIQTSALQTQQTTQTQQQPQQQSQQGQQQTGGNGNSSSSQ